MEIRAFRYRLPLRPIRLAGRDYHERQGLVFCDAEQTKWGEAAPLPGFSQETLDDVIGQWRQGLGYTLPSLRFALDSLEHGIIAPAVPVNKLLSGSPRHVVADAFRCAQLNYPAAKLKVGPTLGSVDECAKTVRRVRAALRPGQTLRLDANRAWSLAEAITFGGSVADLNIEYIEEPTSAYMEMEQFQQETGVPYALDETLRDATELDNFPHAAAFIVKPMLHGGHDDIAALCRHETRLVFSGAFETGVGTCHVARLAQQFSPDVPVGIDAYAWLQEDILWPRLQMTDGFLSVPVTPQICWDALEELTP